MQIRFFPIKHFLYLKNILLYLKKSFWKDLVARLVRTKMQVLREYEDWLLLPVNY